MSAAGRGGRLLGQPDFVGDVLDLYVTRLHVVEDALDHVLQLPDVAGPAVIAQGLGGLRRDPFDALGEQVVVLLDEEVGQHGHVGLALAQGRYLQLDHVDPEVQVLAKFPIRHQPLQILVGGGDDPHVHLAGLDVAYPLDLLLLDHAQQLALQNERHVADLVQENGAPFGQLELPRLSLLAGPGEGAALVAEQLGLGKLGRYGGAVHLDQRLLAPAGGVVYGLGEQFLASAALAGDEHGGVAARDLQHLRLQLGDALVLADDAAKRVAGAVDLVQLVLVIAQLHVDAVQLLHDVGQLVQILVDLHHHALSVVLLLDGQGRDHARLAVYLQHP